MWGNNFWGSDDFGADYWGQAGAAPVTVLPRYRLGDMVGLTFTPAALPPGSPLPTVAITDASDNPVLSRTLWTADLTTFRVDVVLDQNFEVGIFNARWAPAGSTEVLEIQFEVVPGGDPGSDVISLYSHEGVAGRSVLAQLRSGALVQGDGPYVEN